MLVKGRLRVPRHRGKKGIRCRKINKMLRTRKVLITAAWVVLFSAYAIAQNRSMVTGFVKDPGGQPVEKARVELRSESTMTVWHAQTDRSGRFVFTALGQGRYSLRVLVPGSDLLEQTESVELGGGAAAGNDTVQVDVRLRARSGQDERAGAAVIFAQDIPDEALRLFTSAVSEVKRGNPQAAVNELVKALEIYPTYFAALELLGIQYLKHEMFADARKAFEAAVAVNRRSYGSWYGLSYAHFGLEDWANAAVAAENALAIDKSSSQACFVLAMSRRSLKEYDVAEKAFLKAKELDRANNADIHWNLALLYANNLKAYRKAADELETFLKISPNHPEAPHIRKLIVSFRAKQ